MQSGQNGVFSTEDDLETGSHSHYYDQYHYLPAQAPPSPGDIRYSVGQQDQPTTSAPQPPDPVWAQEAYLTVESGDYHLPHPEELMLPPENIMDQVAEAAALAPSPAADIPASNADRKPRSAKYAAAEKKASSKRKEGGESTYILRIHEMLDGVERKGLSSVVAWRPHGRAFKIFDEQAFVNDVLPQYFSAKIVSFQRWLRAWGFCRMTEGKDRGSWYHRYFVRGATRLCKGLSRRQMASAMVGWPPNNQIPDFYSAAAGGTLVEEAPPPPPASNSKNNFRLLRGTILEDLRRMLEDTEVEGNTHIACWQNHGRAFKIVNKGLFEGMMLRYFKTSLMSNLTDTLRLWGFRRLREEGPDKGCFYHKLFVRGQPALCRHVPRDEMRKAMADFPPPEGEPDLEKEAELDPQNASSKEDSNAAPFAMHNNTFTIPYYDPINQSFFSEDMKDDDGSSNRTYVMLLHEMLEDAEKEGNTNIVCWMPHGRAWIIKNEQDFVDKIMPRYFKAQMKSFLRWCRAWGFVRMTEGKDRNAWFHRYFIRGVSSLCRNMNRQQMLKSMENWLPAGHCPDFYNPGSADALAIPPVQNIEPPPDVTVKNPKRLRGTVPEDLRQMLEEAEIEGNSPIVAWCKHGRAFIVYDKTAFTDHILPRYFRASKFTYFSDAIRQWGFRRFRLGPDKGAFYHKLFVRGQPELTRHLTRIQMNESMTPWPPEDGEPNLYDFPPVEPSATEDDAMEDEDEDDDNNGPPLDADAIIAAAEQSGDLPIDSQQSIDENSNVEKEDTDDATAGQQFDMVGI